MWPYHPDPNPEVPRSQTISVVAFMIVLEVVMSLLIPFFLSLYSGKKNKPSQFDVHRDCVGRARAIAFAVMTYAQVNDGWTHPDPDYYVKAFGCRLNSEPGSFGEPPGWYDPKTGGNTKSAQYAGAMKDFCCPLDPAPRLNSHGVLSSYRLNAAIVGLDLKTLNKPPGSLVIVIETHSPHSFGHSASQWEGHWVYGDLHWSLGPDPQWPEGLEGSAP